MMLYTIRARPLDYDFGLTKRVYLGFLGSGVRRVSSLPAGGKLADIHGICFLHQVLSSAYSSLRVGLS